MRFFRRLWFLTRRSRLEAELQEEIEAHRAMAQARLEASGQPAADASAASRRALGNVTRAREDARAMWGWPWVDAARQDVAYALRAIRKNPGFTAAVMLVASLGIGAATSVFTLVDAVVLRPLPVRAPDRLVYFASPGFSYPVYTEVRARTGALFSDFFAWSLESAHVDWTGELEPDEVLTASGEIYAALGIQPAAGRLFDPSDDRVGGGAAGAVAVISDACWKRRFAGDPAVIGRTVRVDRVAFTIVGVTPPGFTGIVAGLAPEVTIPLTVLQRRDRLSSPSSAWLHFMGRLRDNVTRAQANAALTPIWRDVLEVTTPTAMAPDRRAMFLSRETGLESGRAGFSRVRRQFEQPLWLLLALVGLLCAVACASAANLLIARGVARRRELAVRLAIGAGRGRLVRQLLTESLVWSAIGAAAGVLAAQWMSGALVAMMTTADLPLAIDVTPNGRVLAFALALTTLTVAAGSLLPALGATRLSPGLVLRDQDQPARGLLRHWSGGRTLVALQVALTLLLVVGAALFTRSLTSVLSQDPGFNPAAALVAAADAEVAGYEDDRLQAFHRELEQRLAAVPGVRSVALAMYPPITDQDGAWTQSIAVDGAPVPSDSSRTVYFNVVSPRFFSTLDVMMLRGRDFSEFDRDTAPRVVIVNDTLARRFFADLDPVGRRISVGRAERRQDLEIVGVVGTAKYQTLQEEPRAIAYLPVAQQPEGGNLVAVMRTDQVIGGIADAVRREIRRIDRTVPVRIETVEERIQGSLVRERVLARLAAAIGVTALVLAGAALYGLLAYAVSRRRREIGVRVALGANRQTIVRGVLRDCLLVAGVGIVVGLGASIALARFAGALLFKVSPFDGLSLAIATLVVLGVSLAAALLPARRAANVNPVTALRAD